VLLQPEIAFSKSLILSAISLSLHLWADNTSHAVVFVGYDETSVMLNDPAFDTAPQTVAWNEFMLAWSEHDFMYALVS